MLIITGTRPLYSTTFLTFADNVTRNKFFGRKLQMSKLETFLCVIGHYKHLITVVAGVLLVGVLSDTSIVALIKLDTTKNTLQSEVDYYKKQAAEAKKELEDLSNNRYAVEKVARERYFMKHQDEDVFVLSTDIPIINENNNRYATE